MKNFCSFSEAIREGAKLRPQTFGQGVGYDGLSTCAWGAGVEAMVGSLERAVYDACDPLKTYPYLKQITTCPERCADYADDNDIYLVIYHLNDHHRWTREAIADWLETEETQLGFVTVYEEASEPAQEFAEVINAL